MKAILANAAILRLNLEAFTLRHRWLEDVPLDLSKAMKQAVFGGHSKSLRPYLFLWLLYQLKNQEMPKNLIFPESENCWALAIECMHAYSLVHDDLPCMDNDNWRRGMPTIHRQFGQATAVLAGDALLTESFNWIIKSGHEKTILALKAMSALTGASGLIAGQFIELNQNINIEIWKLIHELKTGALFELSFAFGALMSDQGQKLTEISKQLGKEYGVYFQILDDVDDKNGICKFLDSTAINSLIKSHKNNMGHLFEQLNISQNSYQELF